VPPGRLIRGKWSLFREISRYFERHLSTIHELFNEGEEFIEFNSTGIYLD
jgi:hypothetical protein